MFAKESWKSTCMSSKQRKFADAVLAAFQAAGLHTDAAVQSAGGPSSTYMTYLRKAAAGEDALKEPRGDTQRRVEAAAGWPSGSARVAWRTGAAPSIPNPTEPAWAGEVPEGLSAAEHERIVQEVEDFYRWKLDRARRGGQVDDVDVVVVDGVTVQHPQQGTPAAGESDPTPHPEPHG